MEWISVEDRLPEPQNMEKADETNESLNKETCDNCEFDCKNFPVCKRGDGRYG